MSFTKLPMISSPVIQTDIRAAFSSLLVVLLAMGQPLVATAAETPRLRVMIETDAGGDPDDEQSLVRFLLYVNEWDVEGIIVNRPHAREGENDNQARTGMAIVARLVDGYAKCWPRLREHDARYPGPAALRAKLFCGYEDSADGVDAILRAADADDPRPLWFSNWGTDHGSASSSLLRALDRVARERGRGALAVFKQKLRLVSADKFGDHTTSPPPWPLWVDTWRPEQDGRRWYHRFSPLTATAGGFDIERDARAGHGPLGALYPLNTNLPQKEGDTMSFLYLIPTGMNDPEQPAWGSWAGRYTRRADFTNGAAYWAEGKDTWRGSTDRDHTLARWAVDLQNDFRARLDWCVRPRDQANHPPSVRVSGADALGIARITARPGATVYLDATASSDPDRDALTFDWFAYPEAGTCPGVVAPVSPTAARTELQVPTDAAGVQLHLLVRALDNGTPPLARYGRVIIEVER
jgi:hypothetical protein